MGKKINFNLLKIFGLILLVLGLFLIGLGITGKTVAGYTLSDYCKSEMDCANGKVCCVNNEIGFCMNKKMCTQLKGIPSTDIEIPAKNNYSSYIEIGNIIIIIAMIFLFMIYSHEKNCIIKKHR